MLNTILLILLPVAFALNAGTVKQNTHLSLPIKVNGQVQQTQIMIDSNWLWIHNNGGYSNCYDGNGWVTQYCPDPISCINNCQLEGVGTVADWQSTYGITTTGNSLRLNYLTTNSAGLNVGSRVYLLDPTGQKYQMFNFVNREFSYVIDVSTVECGINAAGYSIEMPSSGISTAGAAYGTNYADGQCAKDIKFLSNNGGPGFANLNGTGACSFEFDFTETNKYAMQMTAHTAKYSGVKLCTNDVDCGVGPNRYSGITDKDGGYINMFQLGNTTLWGPGTSYLINTLLPITVRTQFITSDGTDNGDLIRIDRYYNQNGKIVYGGSLTDSSIAAHKVAFGETNRFAQLGGLKSMGDSLKRGHVFALSIWDDSAANMLWLDSTYPVGSTKSGANRGPCPTTSGVPAQTRAAYPNAYVIYSDIQLKPLSASPSPTPAPSPVPTPVPVPVPVPTPTPSNLWDCQQCVYITSPPTPSPAPVPTPTPSPSTCSAKYSQCGGIGWSGPKCCVAGTTCTYSNDWYSQCL